MGGDQSGLPGRLRATAGAQRIWSSGARFIRSTITCAHPYPVLTEALGRVLLFLHVGRDGRLRRPCICQLALGNSTGGAACGCSYRRLAAPVQNQLAARICGVEQRQLEDLEVVYRWVIAICESRT